MIRLDYWDAALFASVFLLYYIWPVIMVLDVLVICRIIKCIKQKKYTRALLWIFVALLMSGSVIFIMIWSSLYG
ncbi:hypothetical protein C5471_22500 [Photorhabdus tasmaniensis]|uniref:Uncharacterized protein n=1 Tax=Photorhabdus tasmaniensis TaxID=1004159 RepID=A0ABX0GP37_9GAMM|nr:hypothetical protein [Photorhabdus tasmaniensis]